MMIRFEIKPEVVEWLEQEYIGEPDATELIEGLMGLMIAHNAITVTPAPDAALVEALRNLLAYVDRQGQAWYPPGEIREAMAVKQAKAALASVEPLLFSIWQRFNRIRPEGSDEWGLWTCTDHVNLTEADARAKLAEIEADELERRSRWPGAMTIYEIRPATKAN